jgi:hypothetical protein
MGRSDKKKRASSSSAKPAKEKHIVKKGSKYPRTSPRRSKVDAVAAADDNDDAEFDTAEDTVIRQQRHALRRAHRRALRRALRRSQRNAQRRSNRIDRETLDERRTPRTRRRVTTSGSDSERSDGGTRWSRSSPRVLVSDHDSDFAVGDEYIDTPIAHAALFAGARFSQKLRTITRQIVVLEAEEADALRLLADANHLVEQVRHRAPQMLIDCSFLLLASRLLTVFVTFLHPCRRLFLSAASRTSRGE